MAVFRTSISGKNDVRLFYQLVAVGDYPDVSYYIFLSFLCFGK